MYEAFPFSIKSKTLLLYPKLISVFGVTLKEIKFLPTLNPKAITSNEFPTFKRFLSLIAFRKLSGLIFPSSNKSLNAKPLLEAVKPYPDNRGIEK